MTLFRRNTLCISRKSGEAEAQIVRKMPKLQESAFASLKLDLDLDAGGDFEVHQGLDGLLGRAHDVDQALVGAALELLAAVLVLVDGAEDRDDLGLGRQGRCAWQPRRWFRRPCRSAGDRKPSDGCGSCFCCLPWCFFSFFRTFSGGIGSRLFLRTDETENLVHTTVRIRPRPKNKPAFYSRSIPRPCDIRVYRIRFLPARFCARHTVGHRTYSTKVTLFFNRQSPASSQCAYVCLTRALE